MQATEAARILGVAPDAPWDAVRRAYRDQIRTHHPDRAGVAGGARASSIIEAYRTLADARAAELSSPSAPPPPPPPPPPPSSWWARAHAGDAAPVFGAASGGDTWVRRLDGDTLLVDAPAEETFRALLDAAHDIGEITYVDRSMPIMEVLCQFEGEPATSLLVTLQGRGHGTEAFCTVESIEARPAPPTSLVVDLLEEAMARRGGQFPWR
jgi:hypothetical protein